jgi:hypothetical protein
MVAAGFGQLRPLVKHGVATGFGHHHFALGEIVDHQRAEPQRGAVGGRVRPGFLRRLVTQRFLRKVRFSQIASGIGVSSSQISASEPEREGAEGAQGFELATTERLSR